MWLLLLQCTAQTPGADLNYIIRRLTVSISRAKLYIFVENWYVGAAPPAFGLTPASTPDNLYAIVNLREDLAAARAEVSGLRDRLADAHAERDRLAALLETALKPRRGVISRIFGNGQ